MKWQVGSRFEEHQSADLEKMDRVRQSQLGRPEVYLLLIIKIVRGKRCLLALPDLWVEESPPSTSLRSLG